MVQRCSRRRLPRDKTTAAPPLSLMPHVPTIRAIKHRLFKAEDGRRSRHTKLDKQYLPPHRKTKRHKRFRSLLGLQTDMKPIDKADQKLQELQPEPLAVRQNRRPCSCVQCVLVRRASSPLAYQCPVPSCREKFDDYVTLFEHQLDEHGEIDARCRQLVAELHEQERAVVPYPPSTVYVGEQFLTPFFRPTPWTLMERVETEYQTLFEKLLKSCSVRSAKIVWGSFLAAYTRLQLGGFPELQRQYRVALEFYNSSLKFPVLNRTAYEIDPCPSVALGRNWLTSSEREDDPFTVKDDDDDDVEIVLIDTHKQKPVHEPNLDASSGSTPSCSIDKSGHDSKPFQDDLKRTMMDEPDDIFNDFE